MKKIVMLDSIKEAKQAAKENKGNNTLYCARNWDQEGAIWMYGATTINVYKKERDRMSKMHYPEVFWAFTMSTFREEIEKLGINTEGVEDSELKALCKGKIFSIFGGYGTKAGIKNMLAEMKKSDEFIKENCDPQEVYIYEYNNHESMIDWEGDTNAIRCIIDYFGKDVAKQIIRYNVYKEIDEICK